MNTWTPEIKNTTAITTEQPKKEPFRILRCNSNKHVLYLYAENYKNKNKKDLNKEINTVF